MTYRNNVGKNCHSSDKAVNPAGSCGPPACAPGRTMPVGWLNPAGFDFMLAANSAAVNAGSAEYAPATDKRGLLRDSRPDAGALEYGASVPGGSGGAAGPGGTASGDRWSCARRRSSRAQICRRPRRGCPASTKLRLRLGRPAKVTIRVQRLRKGHQPKRVRRFSSSRSSSTRPSACAPRRYASGRYRVTVWGTDASGHTLGARAAPAAGALQDEGAPRRSVTPSRWRSRSASTSCRFGHCGARRCAAPK